SRTDRSIARTTTHGTDHACPGARSGDAPLYARLAYSTATAPLLSQSAWDRPIDQSVVLLDGQGRRSHRSGMQTILPPALHPESPTQQEPGRIRSEEHTSELQSRFDLVCRLLLEKKKRTASLRVGRRSRALRDCSAETQ